MSHQREADVDRFLEFFYEGFCEKLFQPFKSLQSAELTKTESTEVLEIDEHTACVMNHLCELLCFTINQHAMFCKNFLLNHEYILKCVSLLLNAKNTHLRLGVSIIT